MDELESHIILNSQAQRAVEDYLVTNDKKSWIDKYEELYTRCTYGPEGLPKIASTNLIGISFHSISKFIEYYECRPI